MAINKMKNGKVAKPSGLVAEMLKAAGEMGIEWMTALFNCIMKEGQILVD